MFTQKKKKKNWISFEVINQNACNWPDLNGKWEAFEEIRSLFLLLFMYPWNDNLQ